MPGEVAGIGDRLGGQAVVEGVVGVGPFAVSLGDGGYASEHVVGVAGGQCRF